MIITEEKISFLTMLQKYTYIYIKLTQYVNICNILENSQECEKHKLKNGFAKKLQIGRK